MEFSNHNNIDLTREETRELIRALDCAKTTALIPASFREIQEVLGLPTGSRLLLDVAYYAPISDFPGISPCLDEEIEPAYARMQLAFQAVAEADVSDELRQHLLCPYRRAYRETVCRAAAKSSVIDCLYAWLGTGGGHEEPGAGTSRGLDWPKGMLPFERLPPIPGGFTRKQARGGDAWSAALISAVGQELRYEKYVHQIVRALWGEDFAKEPGWEWEEAKIQLLPAVSGAAVVYPTPQGRDVVKICVALAELGLADAADEFQARRCLCTLENGCSCALASMVDDKVPHPRDIHRLKLISAAAEVFRSRLAQKETDT